MDATTAVGAILRAINDHTAVRQYGDGLLVDLPLTYGDGDSVRILVEPMGSGYRVSDRATAAALLAMAGVRIDAGRPAEAFREAMRGGHLNGINSADEELATFGTAEDLGRMVLEVAQASMRVEQLRWLAVRQPPVRFHERVTKRVRDWAESDARKVQRDAPVRLRSGRNRSVTLRVSNEAHEAIIQAVASREREQAAEHCYYIFDLAELPKPNRIAALDGSRADWPDAIVTELTGVAEVEFYDDPLGLERAIDAVVPPPRPAFL